MDTKEYNKKYYIKNREKILLKNNKYNNDNKDNLSIKKKDWIINNPTRAKEINKKKGNKYNRKLRVKIIDMMGGKCVHCGFDDYRALQIDHVEGDGTKERKIYNNRSLYYKLIIIDLDNNGNKYQLLCANCNWIKRVENNEYSQK